MFDGSKINKFKIIISLTIYSHPHCTLSLLINLHDATRLHEHIKHMIHVCTIISLNSQLNISILLLTGGRIQKPRRIRGSVRIRKEV